MQFLKVTFLVPNLDERCLSALVERTRDAVPQANVLSSKYLDERCLFNQAAPTLVERTCAATFSFT